MLLIWTALHFRIVEKEWWMCGCVFLSGENNFLCLLSSIWYAQSCIFNRSLLSVQAELFTQFTMLNKEASSIKSLQLQSLVLLVYRLREWKKTVVPILTLAIRQLLLIANWKICHSKRLFDIYYGGMTQSIEEHYRLSHCF